MPKSIPWIIKAYLQQSSSDQTDNASFTMMLRIAGTAKALMVERGALIVQFPCTASLFALCSKDLRLGYLKMTQEHNVSKKVQPSEMDDDLSIYAQKLITYSKEYHRDRPSASFAYCMEMGAGRLIGEYGSGKGHIAKIALSELAAKSVFGK